LKRFVFVSLLLLGGCSSAPTLRDYQLPLARVELTDTPFFAQTDYQCGPAALATVLGASGVETSAEELAPQVYLPGRQGSLQIELVAATRRHRRIPYLLQPDFATLLAEVAGGTPVLVMQNLGLRILPRWHYAVVIGYDAPADTLLLRSGTSRRLRVNRLRFQATWARADNWALVAASPATPPTTAQPLPWLQAADQVAQLGDRASALAAYGAATIRWPDQPLAWQLLANAHYVDGDLAAAEAALRRALQRAPSAAAHNNLAHILQRRGCLTEAEAEISRAEQRADAAALGELLARTRTAISQDRTGGSDGCAWQSSPSLIETGIE